MKAFTKKQLQEDILFLARRQSDASSFSFGYTERDTGLSSNSIVSIAYGLTVIENQYMPADESDIKSCENMWKKLPAHRKQGEALMAFIAASNYKDE